mgnify:FL=1
MSFLHLVHREEYDKADGQILFLFLYPYNDTSEGEEKLLLLQEF